jgi:hypothetical protein
MKDGEHGSDFLFRRVEIRGQLHETIRHLVLTSILSLLICGSKTSSMRRRFVAHAAATIPTKQVFSRKCFQCFAILDYSLELEG